MSVWKRSIQWLSVCLPDWNSTKHVVRIDVLSSLMFPQYPLLESVRCSDGFAALDNSYCITLSFMPPGLLQVRPNYHFVCSIILGGSKLLYVGFIRYSHCFCFILHYYSRLAILQFHCLLYFHVMSLSGD